MVKINSIKLTCCTYGNEFTGSFSFLMYKPLHRIINYNVMIIMTFDVFVSGFKTEVMKRWTRYNL